MNIFDRKAKKMHKDRTAKMADFETYNYLKDEVMMTYQLFYLPLY